MKPHFDLTNETCNTGFAPLCVLGQVLWEGGELDPLRQFGLISSKQVDHQPGEKLMDAFMLILAGYPSLYLINSTLRADPMVSISWHRANGLAEQSNISRTLDACSGEALVGLQQLSHNFWRQHSQLPTHDWRKRLILDLDLTPLLASAKAEASTRGYLPGKKKRPDDNWRG